MACNLISFSPKGSNIWRIPFLSVISSQRLIALNDKGKICHGASVQLKWWEKSCSINCLFSKEQTSVLAPDSKKYYSDVFEKMQTMRFKTLLHFVTYDLCCP